jgi:UDP:flavonoid glycosyltransferase YjiC (YdhE family)
MKTISDRLNVSTARRSVKLSAVAVVCTFVGGWGHAEPLLPVARLAQQLGHEVTFAGQPRIVPRLAELGYRTAEVGPNTLATTRLPLVAVDRAQERAVLADHFVARYGRERSETLLPVIERSGATLVVADSVDVGAVVAAERAGILSVTVEVLVAGAMAVPAVVGDAWSGVRAAAGLARDPTLDRYGGDLALIPAPRSFRDPGGSHHPSQRFVRPAVLDLAAPQPPGRRVYVTLGTIFNLESGDLLERLIEAAGLLDAEVTLTIGPYLDLGDLPPVPDHVRLAPFIPQHEVLPGCGVVVCHAGSGTVVAALALGVPIVALPLGADQPDNADRIAALGAGVVLDPATATPTELAAAAGDVLESADHHRAAAALAAESAAQPPLADVPELGALLAPS